MRVWFQKVRGNNLINLENEEKESLKNGRK